MPENNKKSATRAETKQTKVKSHQRLVNKFNIYTVPENITIDFLKNKNITKVKSEDFLVIEDIAKEFRKLYTNERGNRPNTLVDYFNKAGSLVYLLLNPNSKEYQKYGLYFKESENCTLFIMLFTDPELVYYKTYLDNKGDNPLNKLTTNYGFVSKELLEVERLYDFIIKRRNLGQSEDDIRLVANKIYNLDNPLKR